MQETTDHTVLQTNTCSHALSIRTLKLIENVLETCFSISIARIYNLLCMIQLYPYTYKCYSPVMLPSLIV